MESDHLRFYLTFYPIIPASTNFLVFHIVCQRNVRVLFEFCRAESQSLVGDCGLIIEKLSIIFLVSVFPIIFGLFFDDVGEIFGLGGALVTTVSSYLFPTLMLFKSRRILSHVSTRNPLESPFGHIYCISLLLLTIIFIILSNFFELF